MGDAFLREASPEKFCISWQRTPAFLLKILNGWYTYSVILEFSFHPFDRKKKEKCIRGLNNTILRKYENTYVYFQVHKHHCHKRICSMQTVFYCNGGATVLRMLNCRHLITKYPPPSIYVQQLQVKDPVLVQPKARSQQSFSSSPNQRHLNMQVSVFRVTGEFDQGLS